MNSRKSAFSANLGLAIMAVVAIALCIAAFQRVSPGVGAAVPAPPSQTPTTSVGPTDASSETGVATTDPTATATTTEAVHTQLPPSPTEEAPSAAALSVAILGDGLSAGEPAETWVGAFEEIRAPLSIMNFSAPGRGYIALPRTCDDGLCGNFLSTVDAIAEQQPDVVITFGGVADGDQDLRAAAEDYFTALREALPDAQLIALNPVSTEDDAPYWMTMHGRSIEAGVEAVDGTYVEVGQPSLGSGDQLSGSAKATIAELVAEGIQ